MMTHSHYDYVICGAGIIGLTIALRLAKNGVKSILIIEKEDHIGAHASGRNSGILHSGIYYTQDSLKSQFCIAGSQLMKEFCAQKNIPILNCGKVIVCQNEAELETLHTLYDRSQLNGTLANLISKAQLSELEPLTTTYKEAIHTPTTSVVNPKEILQALVEEIEAYGITLQFSTSYLGRIDEKTIRTSAGPVKFEFFINSAGSFSDRIGHEFGVGKDYRLLPFKGLYKKWIGAGAASVKAHVYPVPDIRNPFLGIHVTKSISGAVYFGPTAIPSLGPENYDSFAKFDMEAVQILYRNFQLFMTNPKYRSVAKTEPLRYIPYSYFLESRKLIPTLKSEELIPCDKVGIRPQLVNIRTKELVMDFVIERTDNSLHLLNAISPAFTCSMAIADSIVQSL